MAPARKTSIDFDVYEDLMREADLVSDLRRHRQASRRRISDERRRDLVRSLWDKKFDADRILYA